MDDDGASELLRGLTHGALALGHLQALIVHWREDKKLDAAVHGLVLFYDTVATYRHLRDMEGPHE